MSLILTAAEHQDLTRQRAEQNLPATVTDQAALISAAALLTSEPSPPTAGGDS